MMNDYGTEKKCNRQLAMCYIIYMICGSYFHRCTSKSPMTEQKMYLHYREMKVAEQERLESMVIREMDRFSAGYLEKIAGLACEASVQKTDDGYRIDFATGGFEAVSVMLKGSGSIRITPA